MIRVMVVEDEPPIQRMICRKIELVDNRFQVVETADNGKDALMYLEAHRDIDVIFVDINLPIMNGIDLLDHLKQLAYEVICVVLSGYKDFEYVKSAYENNAIDYLLKPLKEEELKKVLNKIEVKWTQKIFEKDGKCIQKAVQGEMQEKSIAKGYHMLLLAVGNDPQGIQGSETVYRDFFKQMDIERQVQDIFSDAFVWIIDGKRENEKLIFLEGKIELSMIELRQLFERIQHPSIPITLSYGKETVDIQQIYPVYYALREHIDSNKIFCHSALLVYDCNVESKVEDSRRMEINDLIHTLHKGYKLAQLQEQVCSILASCTKYPVRHQTVYYVMQKFWAKLCMELPRNKEYFQVEKDIHFILENYYDVKEMKKEFFFLLEECFGMVNRNIEGKQRLVAEVRDYLDENYHLNINNKTISEKFGLVPSYLSSIFKEYYQVSMGDYIICKRMEEAKRLLLHSDKRIKDIAMGLGYSDPLYFSKYFKKSTGMSPKEYIAQGRVSEE